MKQTEWELLPKSTNGWSFCLTLQADHWSISPEIAVSIILACKRLSLSRMPRHTQSCDYDLLLINLFTGGMFLTGLFSMPQINNTDRGQ